MDGWKDGWMEVSIEWMNKWKYGWMDGWLKWMHAFVE
jgi:hypothetical protein